MGQLLCQMIGVAALVPALQFGQVPNLVKVGSAAKDSFGAAADAFGKAPAKGAAKGAASTGKTQNEAKPGGYFATMGGQAPTGAQAPSAKTQEVDVDGHKVVISPFGTGAGQGASDADDGGLWGRLKGMLGNLFVWGGAVAVGFCVFIQVIAKLKAYAKDRLAGDNAAA